MAMLVYQSDLLGGCGLLKGGFEAVRRQNHSDNLSLQRQSLARRALLSLAFGALLFGIGAAKAEQGSVSIELNKLEPQGQGCRAYFVVGNKTSTAYQELKLDLVLFRPDGVIGRRFAVDLGPLKPDKKSVKLFDIEGTACDQVGSFLINDVMECKSDTGPIADCLKDIGVSTLTNVQLNK
jgi:hypothetical protein